MMESYRVEGRRTSPALDGLRSTPFVKTCLVCALVGVSLVLFGIGCASPREVRMLQNPTGSSKFLLKEIDEILKESPLPADRNFQIQNVGGNAALSIHVVEARDVPAHYHSYHDETVYVKSGRGVLRVGDMEYPIAAGALMHIPKGTFHSFRSADGTPAVVVSIVSPPSDGRDFVTVTAAEAAAKNSPPINGTVSKPATPK
ncbi:MAG: cupin domain-containing protein [Planctomycetes bacterium]|nr:cupin domain-containing protein [Planctomycetota bacterium]